MTDPRRFPLDWPAGWPRTPPGERTWSAFRSGGARVTQSNANERILRQIRLLGATHLVISANVAYTRAGTPHANRRRPDDAGVAVYFRLAVDGEPRVLACDRWLSIPENMAAIAAHIDAMRGTDRWGVGSLSRAFDAYKALPAPAPAWHEVLGVGELAAHDTVRSAYRRLAREHHPDRGGDPAAFHAVQDAWDIYDKVRIPDHA